ncbi:DUF3618 domain-containing protein [Jannaschia aquimarina]|uniref:DUF3618 domain-containing protein n=1 Tax=Jannaschia aquimarina TaxID=935700 RepID=A0A0D1CRU2_9RHOB|nr:DUF3618 domain-containing protein [Jannaschia aquimarina]KIT17527.1 hypothetical protein jaqu_07160 [Jannaschia aquimarina]SNS73687.1 Protein of unknown function [Jannaschia aquimarina]
MTGHRTSDDIEREIEEERSALTRSLNELQAQFAPDRVMDHAASYLKEHSGELADGFARQVKENPLAAAMVAGGVGWLLFGSAKPADPAPNDHRIAGTDTTPAISGQGRAELRPQPAFDDSEYADAPGDLGTPTHDQAGFDARLREADGTRKEPIEPVHRHIAYSPFAEGGDAEQKGSHDMPTYDYHDIRDRGYARSAELRARLAEGTEKMSEQARLRVMRAREAAAVAQSRVESQVGNAAASGRRAFYEQPLLGGLLVFGIGALVGAALPRTRTEDAYLGVYRDRAFDEADRIFREEMEKLKIVAEAAVDEARAVADEKLDDARSAYEDARENTPTGEDAVRAAEGEVRSAAQRVADAAKSEAEKQNLGKTLN